MELIILLLLIGVAIYLARLSGRVSHLENWARANSKKAPSGATTAAPSSSSAAPVSMSAAKATLAQVKTKPGAPASQMSQPMDSKTFINALPKIGIVALVLGIGFFLKYAIDQGWISVKLRLLIGAGIGLLLLILYCLWNQKYKNYALVLGGGALAIWHLTILASYSLYNLIDVNTALVLMIMVTIVGLATAYWTESFILGALAWCGGYVVPILLGSYTDNYMINLVYLTLLNIGVMMTVWRSNKMYLFAISLFGTLINLLTFRVVSYDSGVASQTAIFLAANFALFSAVVTALIHKFKPEGGNNQALQEYAAVLGAMSVVFLAPLCVIVFNNYRDLAPLILVALSAWVFGMYAIVDRLEYEWVNYVNSTVGSILVTLAIVWQFGQRAEIVVLYLVGLLGMGIGRVQKRLELRVLSLGVVIIGIVTAFLYQYPYNEHILLFNYKFGLEILGLLALGIIYGIYSSMEHSEFENDVLSGLQYIISILLGIFVTWDIIQYFAANINSNQRNLSISLWWLAYGVVLMLVSFVHEFKAVRKVALGLLALVILKVFLYDVQSLDMVYRIISFISLGAILLIISFFYQHNKDKIKQYLDA